MLENTLIEKHLLFKIVTIIPGGQKPKIIGTVCNMEVNLLPHSGDNNGLCKTKTKA